MPLQTPQNKRITYISCHYDGLRHKKKAPLKHHSKQHQVRLFFYHELQEPSYTALVSRDRALASRSYIKDGKFFFLLLVAYFARSSRDVGKAADIPPVLHAVAFKALKVPGNKRKCARAFVTEEVVRE